MEESKTARQRNERDEGLQNRKNDIYKKEQKEKENTNYKKTKTKRSLKKRLVFGGYVYGLGLVSSYQLTQIVRRSKVS